MTLLGKAPRGERDKEALARLCAYCQVSLWIGITPHGTGGRQRVPRPTRFMINFRGEVVKASAKKDGARNYSSYFCGSGGGGRGGVLDLLLGSSVMFCLDGLWHSVGR